MLSSSHKCKFFTTVKAVYSTARHQCSKHLLHYYNICLHGYYYLSTAPTIHVPDIIMTHRPCPHYHYPYSLRSRDHHAPFSSIALVSWGRWVLAGAGDPTPDHLTTTGRPPYRPTRHLNFLNKRSWFLVM